ncbi:MAG: [FeFe] hydrogenase H-cluster maturation GTPase HydF [Calditrichia bacterium]
MPKGDKPHIGIFGRRNIGKSSFINKLTGQDVAIVADYAGTTTDPVKKSIEIHGVGPCIIIDTAGIDDVGEVGLKRIQKTREALKTIDLAILLIADNQFGEPERSLIAQFENLRTPFFIIHNKSDLAPLREEVQQNLKTECRTDILDFSCLKDDSIKEIVDLIKKYLPDSAFNNPTLIGDLVSYGDVVLLVTPIDVEAPKGRLILPQVQTIRDLLDNDCITVILKERELEAYFRRFNVKPKLVITDSQVFLKVDAAVPKDIPMTSFSIIFARYRGAFEEYLKGTPKISELQDGDRILILESCSHHVAGDDIGRVKIPRWLTNFTGKKLEFEVVAGLDQPKHPLNTYSMVIQCGGCMMSRKQITNRLQPAIDAGVPVSNYGMTIAYCLGIYQRAVVPFVKVSETEMDYL